MDIDQQIKKLVVNECACYSQSLNGIVYIKNKPQSITIKDYCDQERGDCRCFVFEGKKCEYFDKAVLPMNPLVEGKSSVEGRVQIYCKKCGTTFLANNYRSQYCDRCKKYLRRESNRNAVVKNRDKCKQSAF